MKRIFLLTVILLALLSACYGNRSKGNELRYGFTTEPKTLDPLNPGNTADGRSILFNVFEGLVKPDTIGRMSPCMAESWTIEQNALVYNFKIRENVRFHDGSIMTVEDIKFSLETSASMGFIGMDLIEEVKITGNNIVTVVLKTPDTEFLPYLTVGIVKKENPDREKNVIGTGPFYIESYTTQQNLVLKKFDNYWQQNLPHLDKVTIVFYENYDAMMVALRGGSIDGSNITGSMAAQLDHRNFDIFQNYSSAVQLLALNNAVPPLDNINVRRALCYGIDIKNIIDTAFFGLGVPSFSPIIPGLTSYYTASNEYAYNPQLAMELLDRQKFSLEITVPSNYTMHVDTAQVIANQLEKIGVNAGIKLVDWNTWLSDVYFGRQYQATIISLDSPIVSPRSFLSRYRSGNAENFINFSNKEFDDVYDSILMEQNDTQRIRQYRTAQHIITGNAASVFIQDIYFFMAFRANAYSGVVSYPLYYVDFSTIYGISKN